MPNMKKPTIAFVAIVGAQLPALVISLAQPGQSSSCLQWASEAVDAARQNVSYYISPPPVSEGYYDVRLKRDVEIYPSPATGATNYEGAHSDAAIGGNEAPASQSRNISGVLPSGMSQSEYQDARRNYDTSMVLGGN